MAIKDGFKEDSAFSEVDRIMLELYPLTRNSGKVKGLLKKIALQLDVMCVAFVKSEGTRFQNHKYPAIKALIVNYLPMTLLMENYTRVGSKLGDSSLRGKMKNWLNVSIGKSWSRLVHSARIDKFASYTEVQRCQPIQAK